MKSARLFTTLGSVVLFGSALFHGSGYIPLLKRIQSDAIRPPMDAILKACWLTLSVQFIALAVIAFLARDYERGGRVVLLCAAFLLLDDLICLYFLGPFIGVYLISIVVVLFLIGGWLHSRQPA
jgi:hypothetical protein